MNENSSTTARMLLRDPDIEPTKEVIAEGLGDANAAFVTFAEAALKHGIRIDWRYYRDGKAWLGKGIYQWISIRGTKREVTVFWLSIWEGFFNAVIYFPEKLRSQVSALALGDKALEMIKHSEQMGKLKFFPVSFQMKSDELFTDFFTLADFKKTAK